MKTKKQDESWKCRFSLLRSLKVLCSFNGSFFVFTFSCTKYTHIKLLYPSLPFPSMFGFFLVVLVVVNFCWYSYWNIIRIIYFLYTSLSCKQAIAQKSIIFYFDWFEWAHGAIGFFCSSWLFFVFRGWPKIFSKQETILKERLVWYFGGVCFT